MKPTSKLFTISKAAKELGYSSRSTLYRLIQKGILDKYLWESGDGKKTYIELNPKGKLSVAQVIASNIQWRSHALHVRN
tara:strand:+ start:293 stop:529 length:237 start_codon:yes stop_codon:yes gene_type:complete